MVGYRASSWLTPNLRGEVAQAFGREYHIGVEIKLVDVFRRLLSSA